MLSLPDLAVGQEIVADNIRAVQAIYFASQLEEMRAFDAAERLAELFQQGLLPLGRRGRGQRLLRSMATANGRLSMDARRSLYARALGVPSRGQRSAGGHRDFHFDWLRFVAGVALFEASHGSAAPELARAHVQRAAIALASRTSARGAGLREAAHRFAADANRLRAVFESPDIQQAFNARDMWQVIEQVSGAELGGTINLARRRTRATASSTVLQWLADHADALNHASALPADALVVAVDQWLASTESIDDESSASASHRLAAMSDQLLDKLGLDAVALRRERPSSRATDQT